MPFVKNKSLVLLLLTGWFLVGCEVGEDTTDATYDVSGSWLYSDTGGRQSTWSLVQDSDGDVTGAGTGGETISGVVSEASISLTLTFSASNSTSSLSGSVTDDLMTGSYTNSDSGNGTWSAVCTD